MTQLRILHRLGLGALAMALGTGCQPLGFHAKRVSETNCPTDVRQTVPWCAGEDAVFQCPCGPTGPTYGARPTCWREWPMPATEWRDMYCATGSVPGCSTSAGCMVSDAVVMPMQLAPLESVPQGPASTPAPAEGATPAAPATDQPLFQPPRSESLPPLGKGEDAVKAEAVASASAAPAWEEMVAEVADDTSANAPVAAASAPVTAVASAAPFVPPAPQVPAASDRVALRTKQGPQPAAPAATPAAASWLTGPAGQVPTAPQAASRAHQAPMPAPASNLVRLEGTPASERTEIRLAAEPASADASTAEAPVDEKLESSDNPFGRWLRQ